jgi:hypothetical protein
MARRHQVRHLVQAEIAARLVAKRDDPDIEVQDGVVARDVTKEAIGIGDVVGVEMGLRNMVSGRKMRIDRFSFPIQFNAEHPGQTPAEAKARVAVMVSWLEDICGDDATLGDLLQSIQISAQNGPDAADVTGGSGGYVTATVLCHSEQN